MNLDEAVVVALGSNQPFGALQPREVLEAALARFPAFGMEVVKRSSWWRSAAWPDAREPEFLNGVALVDTTIGARDVMAALLLIEAEFGRRRGEPNAPRTLDLDLIAHGRTVLHEPGLELPHSRSADRYFVMAPLTEIAPGWRHPLTGDRADTLKDAAAVGRDAFPNPERERSA
ncbi:MAG TPA: 2-amino-4-hydroxy-6-hydroxymethyldihydropteridine diphosphokinase [Caulobacteraceae bacterium]|jgi:2-amino-4-hydroxy-6-hydroxymethyldihydropteridine diphosphokinase